jgi:hypothetical protein
MLEMLDDLFKDQQLNASRDLGADEIILIVDRSGSMSSIREDAQGGINTFIKEQQKEGNANLTLVEFDQQIDAVYKQTDIKNVNDYELMPRGGTALYDAIGATLANADSVATTGKKIVVIVTDGGENSSREWTQEAIFDRIDSLKENDWDFLFLAANQDAMATGVSLGMAAGETVAFAASGQGMQAGYAAAVNYTSNLRSGMSKGATLDALDLEIKASADLGKNLDDIGIIETSDSTEEDTTTEE